MSDYTEFFLSTPSSVAQLDLIDITHPNFLKDYFIVRNSMSGVTVLLEDGTTSRDYKFYPLQVKPLGFKDDLEQGFEITLGDTGDTLPEELEAVQAADGFGTPPTFVYRSYRSDNLLVPVMGPITLEIKKVSMDEQGATFEAHAPKVNDGRSGELYRIDRFPMLRGLL